MFNNISSGKYKLKIALRYHYTATIQNDWVEQWICIKFCVKFEHSSAETIWTIQKAAVRDNWWLAASSWQCAPSCITSPAKFCGESPRWLSPLQPRFGTLWLLALSKTKIIFEMEEIAYHYWDSGSADGDWENYVRSQGA